jgi:catechol 2,3-dioxygenase-like lactoylglutathione lyase family enzyme
MPRSRARTITPLLTVSDLQRAIDFYRNALGFEDPDGHRICIAQSLA